MAKKKVAPKKQVDKLDIIILQLEILIHKLQPKSLHSGELKHIEGLSKQIEDLKKNL
jgi:hypothetical protein